ncbi:MAG: transcription antitermination factor NusB [Bacteroidetes bacterium]|nr:transcription antitermination factor NusB [Bacteroidota bacterium]
MLNRRILRVKAFQNLYAYEQCKGSNINIAKDFIRESFLPDLKSMEVQDKAALYREGEEALRIFEQNVEQSQELLPTEVGVRVKKIALEALKQVLEANEKDRQFLLKNMVVSAERIPQLYLLAIELLQAFSKHVGREVEKKQKLAGDTPIAFGNELNLANNQVLKRLRESPEYRTALGRNGVNLDELQLEIKEWFREYIKPAEPYQNYLSISAPSLEQDFELVDELLKKIIFKNEVILTFFADKDLNWTENKSVVRSLAAKVLKNSSLPDTSMVEPLPEIAMNWEEDKEFFENIFNFTIANDVISKVLISEKTKNWDIERFAFTDRVIISMALAEMIHFPSIPVKVTINEYIDISKTYSTPKSKQFINGLLDVLAKELTEKGQIRKSGRGLLDNK